MKIERYFKICYFLSIFIIIIILAAGCVESQFPNQGLNPYPLFCKCGVLTTELPGKSPKFVTLECNFFLPTDCYEKSLQKRCSHLYFTTANILLKVFFKSTFCQFCFILSPQPAPPQIIFNQIKDLSLNL